VADLCRAHGITEQLTHTHRPSEWQRGFHTIEILSAQAFRLLLLDSRCEQRDTHCRGMPLARVADGKVPVGGTLGSEEV